MGCPHKKKYTLKRKKNKGSQMDQKKLYKKKEGKKEGQNKIHNLKRIYNKRRRIWSCNSTLWAGEERPGHLGDL